MQLHCPHCHEKLGLFTTTNGQLRVEKGKCPLCGTRVAIGASPKGFVIALSAIGLIFWVSWGMIPPVVLGLLGGILIWLLAIRLVKAPDV